MYVALVYAHSWLRWLLLVAALYALVRAISGASSRRPWTPDDDRAGKWLVSLFDLQLLIGLVLYIGLSPVTQSAFNDFGAAMRQSDLRFWAVEHVTGMVIAAALLHIGRVRVSKAAESKRHRTAAIFIGLALLAMLISIPWPGTPAGRPLFRLP